MALLSLRYLNKKSVWLGLKKVAMYLSADEKVNFIKEMISYASYLYLIEQKTTQPAIDIWITKFGE